jgi:hypothetical protein
MVLDDAVDHRQAEAGALARGLGGEEGFEHPVQQGLGNAAALVLHLHLHEVAAQLAVHQHAVPGQGGLDGVVEQVDEDLQQALVVAPDRTPFHELVLAGALPGAVAQLHQLDGLVHAGVQVHRGPGGIGQFTRMAERDQALHDVVDTPGLLQDLPCGELPLRLVLFVVQVLGQGGDAGQRVADLVGDARRQASDGGEAVVVGHLALQAVQFRQVLHQDHRAARQYARVQGARGLDGGLVQVDPAAGAVDVDVQLVEVAVVAVQEGAQDAVPGFAQLLEPAARGLLAGDARDQRHGGVPDDDLPVRGQGAHAQGQLVEHLPVVAAQGVQFRRQALEADIGMLQLLLHEAQAVRDGHLRVGIHPQPVVDDHA